MADIVMLSNRDSSLIIAKSQKARLHFTCSYQDISRNSEGDPFITRNREAAEEIKKECVELGMLVEEK